MLSLKYLKNNKNLKSITVIVGNLSDISDLKAFIYMENVIIPNNKIKYVSVFTNLQKFKKIDLTNNPMSMLNKNLQVVINFDYDNADFITKTPYWYRNWIKEFIILPEDKPKIPTNLTAKLPTFDTGLYPFIVYNDITYSQ